MMSIALVIIFDDDDDISGHPLVYTGWIYGLCHIALVIVRTVHSIIMAYFYYERNQTSKLRATDVFGEIFWGNSIPDEGEEEEEGLIKV
jgi:hypothetical protein